MLTERADMLRATLPSTEALADHGALALNHRLQDNLRKYETQGRSREAARVRQQRTG